ncbi:DNA topoisomerase 2 [Aspergillus fumigatus]|nr:DNA topoisomerase 2 [Aspergillus fumigatus]KAH1367878.1 DNA topoisomerase 2 [Aspergillus fumigatus]KAH1394650.1 DNA topoisomerase 2 [Aspergillus fumigatus]KAH1433458.1 DNA topoisomerase 2 [Aspergillus fumigatus]KAH1781895.1 DNA topoisomerase 2 [Aspergillus fumigatus]
MDDSIMEGSIFEDDGSSDFVPEPGPKPRAKAAPKKAAPKKLTQTKLTAKPAAKATASKKRSKPDSEDDLSDDMGMSDDDSDSSLSQTPPKKVKKAPASKKGGSNPLADVENESFGGDIGDQPATSTNASEKYQKLTQLEHIIKRPDTYIGSVERTTQFMWVYDSETEGMKYKEVSYVPGLYKIFDEIVVNAADNKQNDANMDEIRVTIDRESGEISVWNNGRGIPIEIHAKEGIYVPELIFGHLLTSSNYDDTQKKVTGGRNGFGAKLCNVFSTEFTIETQDSRQKKKYKQTWTNNMSKMGKAKITDAKGEDYTKVTFKPDYAKFGMEGMDDDFEALVKRRVYDLAGTTKVAVKLNGSRIPVRNFKKYMEMYTKAIRRERGEEDTNAKDEIITCSPDPRWEIGFAVSDGSFHQVSFVNSIATTSGGTHVNYIADQICARLADQVKKKNKNGATLKPAQIRNHIFIFVNALIVNPAFTSQTKEQLTTKSSQFGSKCVLEEDFYKKILRTEVMNNILHFAQAKADQLLKKTDGGRRTRMNNPKLVDANKAGTKDGHHCTLILTEGDSAKGLAMAGRAVVGPDLFGVFPLRGKLLNVRDASFEQISKNQEIQNIKNFLGLQHKKEYTDTRGLRYGHLMIMTDQDHDGSHIKGLLINFLQAQFPSLLKIPEFLIEFITPIAKVWKGDPKNPTKQHSFFTMPEYEAWKEEHKHERGWEHKYYKGLGTSTTEDAQVYFRDLDRHLKEFHTLQDHETELIELAFSKKKADERKEWLRQFKPGTFLDHSVDKITYTDFINKELILFSMADNQRSIPSVVDGLKPGQRKVLYTCFRRNLRKDMKVVELAGHVSGMTAYQHGDASLQQTIVGLAQTFVGSNNINCLEPSGNFGSRLQGGQDCASARYIYTRLSPFARRVFHAADDPLLTYNEDDGKKIEPEVYVPVVPMILINGADGIGTGWSSSIPNYNPEDIVDNLKRLMDGQPVKPMQPWFRGFTGEVTALGGDRFKFSGIVKETGDKEVEITELPIRTWTQDFKDKLEEIIKAEKTPSFIKDYKDYNTHTKVHFVIQMDEKNLQSAREEGLEEKFKLSKTIATTNLVAFDPEGRITKYASVDDILKEFYAVRLKFYERRKQYQLNELQKELDKLTNQARFVQMIIDGDLVISKKKKPALVAELKKHGFKAFPKVIDAVKAGEDAPVVEEEEDESGNDETEVLSSAYDYLLGMPLWSLTHERVEKLRRQIGEKEVEIDALIKLSKEDIWKRDLDDFINEWRFQLEDEARRQRKVANMGRRTSAKLMTAAGRGKATKKRKAALDDDSDDEDFAAPKSKKSAAAKKTEPKGGLLSYLGKPSAKPAPSGDGGDSDDDFEVEVLPKKNRGAATKATTKVKDEDEVMDDLGEEILPKKSRGPAKPAPKPKEEADDDSEDIAPKKGRAAAKAKPKPKVEDDDDLDDDEFMEIAKAEAAKSVKSQPNRTSRKITNYTALDDSDSDNGDDLLGDVSKMVKGIGGATGDSTTDSRQLFSERSRPSSSSSGLKVSSSKPSKLSTDFDADETDYSKLIPQNSPRRSLQVKPKETKVNDDFDMDDDDDGDPVKPAAKAKPVAKKGKSAATAASSKPAAAPKPRGRPKKDAAKPAAPAPSLKQTTLSPAAKAYASKQAKATATKKKQLVDDLSDDDIDAMANDILDSPAARMDVSEDDEPPKRKTTVRPARRTAAAKKTYVIEDDSEDDDGGDSGDDFDEEDSE